MEKFIKKLRELPENKKKIILWTTVIFLGMIFFVFFIKNTTKKINNLQGNYFYSETKVSELQKDLNSVPTQDMGQAIKQIQDILNQTPSVNSGQANNQNNDQSTNQDEN
jgi:hypothetical protein